MAITGSNQKASDSDQACLLGNYTLQYASSHLQTGSAWRWAEVWTIFLMFQKLRGSKSFEENENPWREKRADADSNL